MSGRTPVIGSDPKYHEVGSGFAVEWWSEVIVDDLDGERLPHHLRLVREAEDDRLVCISWETIRRPNGPPITADSLKRMPVVRAMKADADKLVRLDGTAATESDLKALSEVELVAVLYRLALFSGQNPTTYVATFIGVSRDVAAKRVQKARRVGLLAQTTIGRKGGGSV